jgi:AraC-like DNA-binding protein
MPEEPVIYRTRGVVRGHAAASHGVLPEHLTEPWTLSSLAEAIHLSRSQLVRASDASVGITPMAPATA